MSKRRKPKIERVNPPDGDRGVEKLPKKEHGVSVEGEKTSSEIRGVVPPVLVKSLANIATNAWKARSRTMDPNSGEVRDEMRRVCCDIERIQRCLNDLGIVVEDHTNMPFDYGLPWNVIATKPMPGIAKEIVTETLKPTVRWNQQIIQHAEVEIGTPTGQEVNV